MTPYVGAGLGAAYLSLHDYRYRSPASPTLRGRIAGGSEWNAAYALMAGVGLEIATGVTLDAGYRYAALGAVETGGRRGVGPHRGVALDDIAAHEVLVTLRYMFD